MPDLLPELVLEVIDHLAADGDYATMAATLLVNRNWYLATQAVFRRTVLGFSDFPLPAPLAGQDPNAETLPPVLSPEQRQFDYFPLRADMRRQTTHYFLPRWSLSANYSREPLRITRNNGTTARPSLPTRWFTYTHGDTISDAWDWGRPTLLTDVVDTMPSLLATEPHSGNALDGTMPYNRRLSVVWTLHSSGTRAAHCTYNPAWVGWHPEATHVALMLRNGPTCECMQEMVRRAFDWTAQLREATLHATQPDDLWLFSMLLFRPRGASFRPERQLWPGEFDTPEWQGRFFALTKLEVPLSTSCVPLMPAALALTTLSTDLVCDGRDAGADIRAALRTFGGMRTLRTLRVGLGVGISPAGFSGQALAEGLATLTQVEDLEVVQTRGAIADVLRFGPHFGTAVAPLRNLRRLVIALPDARLDGAAAGVLLDACPMLQSVALLWDLSVPSARRLAAALRNRQWAYLLHWTFLEFEEQETVGRFRREGAARAVGRALLRALPVGLDVRVGPAHRGSVLDAVGRSMISAQRPCAAWHVRVAGRCVVPGCGGRRARE